MSAAHAAHGDNLPAAHAAHAENWTRSQTAFFVLPSKLGGKRLCIPYPLLSKKQPVWNCLSKWSWHFGPFLQKRKKRIANTSTPCLKLPSRPRSRKYQRGRTGGKLIRSRGLFKGGAQPTPKNARTHTQLKFGSLLFCDELFFDILIFYYVCAFTFLSEKITLQGTSKKESSAAHAAHKANLSAAHCGAREIFTRRTRRKIFFLRGALTESLVHTGTQKFFVGPHGDT